MSRIRVISGGQTGADVAGLWVAKFFGCETGGVAPGGFQTLIGPRPEMAKTFGLTEGPDGYPRRTKLNVEAAEVTLVFSRNMTSPGTKLTVNLARKANKPVFAIRDWRSDFSVHLPVNRLWDEASEDTTWKDACSWVVDRFGGDNYARSDEVLTINVAGNATKNAPESFEVAFTGLWELFLSVPCWFPGDRFKRVSRLNPYIVDQEFKDKYSPHLLKRVEQLVAG